MQLTMGVLVAVVAAALVVFALVLADAQSSSQDDIKGRVHDRAVASSTLISSLFTSASSTATSQNVQRYGGARVPSSVLDAQSRAGGSRYLALVDAGGRLIAASRTTTDDVRQAIARRPPYLEATLRGQPFAISGVERGASGETRLDYAQGFPTPHGRRVLIAGIDPKLLNALLGNSLARLPHVKGGQTLILDATGAVVASPDRGLSPGSRIMDPGLVAAVRQRGRGDYGHGRYFTADAVRGTPWRVVLTAPRRELFASVDGIHRWGPWALFAAFALAAVAAIALVGRSGRDARRVAAANAQLGVANSALAERARELARANDELGRANTELERSNEELDRFASIASHDLREPLRKVQMFSERMVHHESANLSERGRDYLDRMSGAADRMQSLIDGLLQYSRVSTRATPREDVDLGAVVRDVVDDLDALVRETGGSVEAGPLPHVPADPLQMRQLLQNLITNALRFHREGVAPRVLVDGHEDGHVVEVTVRDNGIGFESQYADRIFQLFERLHGRSEYPGTGMGLALCRRIVERHGGTIAAEGRPGEGSTFTFTLPLRPGDQLPSRSSHDPEQERAPLVPS